MQKLFPRFSTDHVCLMPFSSSASFIRFLDLFMLKPYVFDYKDIKFNAIKTTRFYNRNHLSAPNFIILRISVVRIGFRGVNYDRNMIAAKRENTSFTLFSSYVYVH